MDPIRAELQDVFRQVFGDDEIVLSDSTTADDIDGWDSMMHINLIIAIEKRFRREVRRRRDRRHEGRRPERRHVDPAPGAEVVARQGPATHERPQPRVSSSSSSLASAVFFSIPGARARQLVFAACSAAFLSTYIAEFPELDRPLRVPC